MINAVHFDRMLDVLKSNNSNIIYYSNKLKKKINELFLCASRINCQTIRFTLPKGNIKDFYSYKNLLDAHIVINYKEYKKIFNKIYSKEKYLYEVKLIKYKSYRQIYINNKLVVYTDIEKVGFIYEEDMLIEVLDTLIKKQKEGCEIE